MRSLSPSLLGSFVLAAIYIINILLFRIFHSSSTPHACSRPSADPNELPPLHVVTIITNKRKRIERARHVRGGTRFEKAENGGDGIWEQGIRPSDKQRPRDLNGQKNFEKKKIPILPPQITPVKIIQAYLFSTFYIYYKQSM